jgi:hypothetical protein
LWGHPCRASSDDKLVMGLFDYPFVLCPLLRVLAASLASTRLSRPIWNYGSGRSSLKRSHGHSRNASVALCRVRFRHQQLSGQNASRPEDGVLALQDYQLASVLEDKNVSTSRCIDHVLKDVSVFPQLESLLQYSTTQLFVVKS